MKVDRTKRMTKSEYVSVQGAKRSIKRGATFFGVHMTTTPAFQKYMEKMLLSNGFHKGWVSSPDKSAPNGKQEYYK